MIDLSKGCITFTQDIHEDQLLSIKVFGNLESMVDCYEELIAKAIIHRASMRDPNISEANQEKVFPYIQRIIVWLRNGDFYTAPASAKYHNACNAGLLIHTLEVYNQLVGLRSVPKFKDVVDKYWWSAVFAVLVHDWCKIGRYESYLKWVKDDCTDDWKQEPAYRYKDDSVGRFGHGTQSLIMAMHLCASKYTSLSFEEMAAIRWHMDAWDIGHYDEVDLAKCNATIPMVRMIQFADQLAITEY